MSRKRIAAAGCTGIPIASSCELSGPVDPMTGFVLDFFEIEAAFGPLLARLDHYCLNEIEGLENPTAENIAVWIWSRTKPALPALSQCPGLRDAGLLGRLRRRRRPAPDRAN